MGFKVLLHTSENLEIRAEMFEINDFGYLIFKDKDGGPVAAVGAHQWIAVKES